VNLPQELEAALHKIAAREQREVSEVIHDALQSFAASRLETPSWVGSAKGPADLSRRVVFNCLEEEKPSLEHLNEVYADLEPDALIEDAAKSALLQNEWR
jgi:metal-responsive CopG/Arc/MetJ family transcriptional regulator